MAQTIEVQNTDSGEQIFIDTDVDKLEIEPATIARTIVFIVAWINQLFAFVGLPVVDFEPEATYLSISSTITFLISVYTFWKNNSFTIGARIGDIVMRDVNKADKE